MKSGTTYYTYQNDHLGTPMKLLSQSGAVVWSATYDAFGKATVDAVSSIGNNLRFPGQYFDVETGLHYNWMRYYDSGSGRYVTSDPIGLYGGINLYAYVGGNPIGWFDSFGLISCTSRIIKAWTENFDRPSTTTFFTIPMLGYDLTGKPSLGAELPDHSNPRKFPASPEVQATMIFYLISFNKIDLYNVTEQWQRLSITCKRLEEGPCGEEVEVVDPTYEKNIMTSPSKKLISTKYRFNPDVELRSDPFGLSIPGLGKFLNK